MRRLARWYAWSLLVVLLDQVTKYWISVSFAFGETRAYSSFFNLVLTYNKGAAFSFLAAASGWQRGFFIMVALVAIVVISVLLARHAREKLFCVSLVLILGGAIGNVLDRIVLGHVVDFLDFHVAAWHWPAFNLADSAITVGALLLIADSFRGGARRAGAAR
jgi:signal peptidase II